MALLQRVLLCSCIYVDACTHTCAHAFITYILLHIHTHVAYILIYWHVRVAVVCCMLYVVRCMLCMCMCVSLHVCILHDVICTCVHVARTIVPLKEKQKPSLTISTAPPLDSTAPASPSTDPLSPHASTSQLLSHQPSLRRQSVAQYHAFQPFSTTRYVPSDQVCVRVDVGVARVRHMESGCVCASHAHLSCSSPSPSL